MNKNLNVDCVILAAGFSARAGTNKMLLKINKKTIIEHCINAFYEDCSKIIVVTGHYHRDIENILSHYDKVFIKYNHNYKKGMFCSVKTGLEEISSERFFLTPGDYPLLKTATIKHMLKTETHTMTTPVYNGIQGHPVLLNSRLIPSITNSDAESLRDCLKDIDKYKLDVNDIGIISDIDTMEDFKKIEKIFKEKQ